MWHEICLEPINSFTYRASTEVKFFRSEAQLVKYIRSRLRFEKKNEFYGCGAMGGTGKMRKVFHFSGYVATELYALMPNGGKKDLLEKLRKKIYTPFLKKEGRDKETMLSLVKL